MKDFDYQKTRGELDELLSWFESEDINIDEAISKYKRAEELINQLESYLADTKVKIEQITKKSSGD